MKKLFLLFYIFFQVFIVSAQRVDTAKNYKLDENYYNKKFDDIQKKIDDNQKQIDKDIASVKQETKDILNIYVWGFCIVAGLIGFAINFFGRQAIKTRVEEIISQTAQDHVDVTVLTLINSKITTELIAELIKDKSEKELSTLLTNIETKGESTINQIRAKGNEVLNSMIAAPRVKEHTGTLSEATDDEINELNTINRSNEFFKLASAARDPKIKIELYKNVIELQPENIAAYNNISVAYNDIDNYIESIKFSSKAIEIKPNFDIAYSNRAHSYNQLNDFQKSLSDAETAISLNPQNDFAYAVKGNVLTKQNKFIEAEEALNTSIALNPNSPSAFFHRAYFYEERKQYEKSEIDYLNAEKNGFPNKANLYNNMAVLYRRQRKFPEAIDMIRKAREQNPNYPNLDGTLALIYADQGMEDEFYAHITSALEKGCRVWNYLGDYGFDNYRNSPKLTKLIETYKKVLS